MGSGLESRVVSRFDPRRSPLVLAIAVVQVRGQRVKKPSIQDLTPTQIPRQVWLLGWTSLFTDAATEIIYPLLPLYLSRVLGASATSLGIVEGVAEAIN